MTPWERFSDRAWRIINRGLDQPIVGVATDQPVVALTFDDGPGPDTERLLAVLARHCARATFFLIGEQVRRHPRLVDAIVVAGHVLGNHTDSHPDLTGLSPADALGEIERCAATIGGQSGRLFRPPFGRLPALTRRRLRRGGYQVVKWSVSSEDWHGESGSRLAARVERQLVPGSIVLFHDHLASPREPGFATREPTIEAVDLLLQRCSSRFRFETVSRLLETGRAIRDRRVPPRLDPTVH